VKFSDPIWLLSGLLACLLLVWMWRRYDARQHIALAKFVAPHLRRQLTHSISPARRRIQRGLYLGALLGLFVALAGPLVGFRWEQVSRRGNEIVFAIDTSRSMSTPDVKPNRLLRAKLAIDDMARQLDGDAVGIVAFAGAAFLVCPITLDYGAFHESLGAIDTQTIPRGGTNISSAIAAAAAALRRRPGSDKIMILVTDGEELEGSALEAASAAYQQDGLKIFTVGVGTAAGELIPIPADQGGGFVKDEFGVPVKSQLDEAALKAIAAAAGGRYEPLGAQGEGLEVIARTILGTTSKHDLAFRQQRVYIPRFQWPLGASLGLLLSSLVIGTRRWGGGRRTVKPSAAATAGVGALMVIALHLSRAPTAVAQAAQPQPTAPNSQSAPKEPIADYNQGTAAYRAGQFPQASQAFQQSIRHAPSSDLKRLADQQDAYYNLGNALYRSGQKTEQSAPQETLQKWNDAVKAYETALQLRADDADSKFNRDLVKRKIDELNKKQNPPPNPQNQGNPPPQGGSGQGQPPPSQPQKPPPGSPPSQGSPPAPQPQQPPPQAPQPPQQQPPQQQPPQQQPPQQQPPQQQPPQQQPPQQQPPQQQPPQNAAPPPSDEDDKQADAQRQPGQMSRDEARELLDSAKGEERHPPGVPAANRDAYRDPPEKPFKNW
jgi:Ca-activated chloride channel homolog